MGAAVGLSANGAAERVRRLRDRGVIAGFTTMIAPGATAESIEALIDVKLAPDHDDETFEAAVRRIPQLVADLHLTGPVDHQLRVSCGDATELNQILRALRRHPSIVHVETRLILNELIHQRSG